jgi:signal transduction histidine kinase
MLSFLWPRSLRGQVLLAIALSLLLAQGIGASLLYRAQHDRIEGSLIHSAAFRIIVAARGEAEAGQRHGPPIERDEPPPPDDKPLRLEHSAASPVQPGEARNAEQEAQLRNILSQQDLPLADVVVVHRPVARDARSLDRLARRKHADQPAPDEVLVAGVRLQNAPDWMVARVFIPNAERFMLRTLFTQTLFIYAVLVGAMWLLLRRITRPLAALTQRLEYFAETRDPEGRMEPNGPEDVARLITAHNAMESRIVALLDEKDVMLGAIGHDLKTPLAALRVRIESVEDETERAKMARTIEDITRTLDDILSLARVGRPSDAAEQTELSALVASVVEEYEDMGEPVGLADTQRVVLRLRPTWIRRALRNLIGNGLRYGQKVEVALERIGDMAVIRICDEGPGIAEDQITRMLEPFTRGDPSRNSETGGAGLGLTLARAIAEQHGGTLELSNRPDGMGLCAILRLPLAQ